jgi:arginyl-tRNA synthetase
VQETIRKSLEQSLKTLGITPGNFVVEHPGDIANGDYSTNVALAHSKELKTNPRELAEKIVGELLKLHIENLEKIEIAGPGFINFHLANTFFAESVTHILETENTWGNNTLSEGKKVMVEYTDPNPFKPFHIGHLMTNAIGESVARIFQASGAHVVRANYQGDVGLHVAKAIWMLLKKGTGDTTRPANEQATYIGACYSEASNEYDTDPEAKSEIDAINKKIYEKSDPEINAIYDWGRKVTLEAFEDIYKLLGTQFQHYFFESEMAPIGAQVVRENTPNVFTESDGAVVFHAENYDPKLHTRVFITKQGLPTYEAKEIGLTITKFAKENPDTSIVVTAIEQGPYMEVVQKAISFIHPDYESRMKHLTHGMMRFASGKMSSRKGNVITGESLIADTNEMVYEKMADREFTPDERSVVAAQVGIAAIKYTILKQALGGNIIYDEEKSVSFEGDSGPYLQYTVVRAGAVMAKGAREGIAMNAKLPEDWTTTALEKHLYRFPEIVAHAYELREPHHIAVYLTELASLFNSFYGAHQIVNSEDAASPYKLALTQAFATTMKKGLYLLGISVPEKM